MVAEHPSINEQPNDKPLSVQDNRVPQWLAEGSAFLRTNQLLEAKERFANVLNLSPSDGQALNLLALCDFRLGNFAEAETQFCKLIESNPDDPSLRINLAMVYMKTRQSFKAREIFMEILRVTPDHPRLPTYMGLVEEDMGNLQQALQWYQRSGNVERAKAVQELIEKGGEHRPFGGEEASIAAVTTPPSSSIQTSAAGIEAAALIAASAESMKEPVSVPTDGQAGVARKASLGYTLDVHQLKAPVPGTQGLPSSNYQPLKPEDFQRPATGQEAHLMAGPAKPSSSPSGPVPCAPIDISSLPSFLPDQKHPYRWCNALYIPISGLIYLRPHYLSQVSGKLKYEAIRRRYRGKSTDSFFAGAKTPLCSIRGEGVGVLQEDNFQVTFLELDHSDLYLLEQSVVGFYTGLDWENGRLPGKGKIDLDIVHLKGTGRVMLSTPGSLTRLEVTPDNPVFVAPESLVGWSGELVPSMSKLGDPEKGVSKLPMVGFSGSGQVLGLNGG